MREQIRWLLGLEQFGMKLGLDGVRSLLEACGRPDTAYPSILVGGTNGKGSVAATIEAILRASGLRVGLYTSPHLLRTNERIRLGGADIGDDELCGHLDAIRGEIARGLRDGSLQTHPSFFEVTTTAALCAFRDAHVDAAVLEVGLGGRLDATNAVEAALSVIVTIDLDHTDRLGSTRAEIAAEKAGIVKPGRTLVSGVTQEDAREILRAACARLGSPLLDARTVARIVAEEDGGVTLETNAARYERLRPILPGRHQVENLQVIVTAVEVFARILDLRLSSAAVREGLQRVRWPGRLQWIAGSPPLLLDGAHNPAGAAALAVYLGTRRGPRPVLVFGAVRGKDFEEILAPLAGLVDAVVLTAPRVERAADPFELESVARGLVDRLEVARDPVDALERARALTAPGGFVLVAGSLYLVGNVLALLEGSDAPGPISM